MVKYKRKQYYPSNSARKRRTSEMRAKYYNIRQNTTVLYFGGKATPHDNFQKPKFLSKKNREELEKLMFPFMKDLYCHYSSPYDKKKRNEINVRCMQDFEQYVANEGDCFQYPEAGEMIKKKLYPCLIK